MSLSKEAMHTASLIMALSGKSIETKVADMSDITKALKNYKIRGMKSDLMPMAAALGIINATLTNNILEEIILMTILISSSNSAHSSSSNG